MVSPPVKPVCPDRLYSTEGVESPKQLISPDGKTKFAMQDDGNLVLYKDGKPVWSTNTYQAKACKLEMQNDGNLVVTSLSTGKPVWASKTVSPGAFLTIQNDGNAVIYDKFLKAIWATGTSISSPQKSTLYAGDSLPANGAIVSPNQQYKLVMQRDGNCVQYGPTGPLWHTNTAGPPDKFEGKLAMGSDGILRVLDKQGNTIWQSEKTGRPESRLVIQDDGDLIITKPAWTRGYIVE